MKIGDTIRRKDMPNIQCRITGKSKKFENYWVVLISGVKGYVDMNDERWEVVE